MKILNKAPIVYNGTCFYITIIKKNECYEVKLYLKKSYLLFIKFKKIANCVSDKSEYKIYHGNIDKIIKDSFEYFEKNIRELIYSNNYSKKYIVDEEYKQTLYLEFYHNVMEDLEKKGILLHQKSMDYEFERCE